MSSAVRLAGAAAPCATDYDADIIILSLGRTRETLAAIASARAQTGVTTHLFVLDQGSSTAELGLLAAAIDACPHATLLVAPYNLGVAGGRNLLSGLGHGRVIIALDNDATFAAADTAACMVAGLDAEPKLAAIGCRIVTATDDTDDRSSWGYPASLLPFASECFDAITYVGAGHALRRSAWVQAGGYDERLFFCWEEFDFCLRAIALGWRVRYRGDIVIRHAVSAEHRVHWSADRWFYFVRNRLYIEGKIGAGSRARAFGYLVKGLRSGLLLPTLRAIAAAHAMRPRAGLPLPRAALAYLRRNDAVHRGGWVGRIRGDVLTRIGAAATARQ